jgi:hypothetical protein
MCAAELGEAGRLNILSENFVLHFVRIFHEKLNLVNALFHDPGKNGIKQAHGFR